MFFLRNIPVTQHQTIRKLIYNSSKPSSTSCLLFDPKHNTPFRFKHTLNQSKLNTALQNAKTRTRSLSSNNTSFTNDENDLKKRQPISKPLSSLARGTTTPMVKSLRKNRNPTMQNTDNNTDTEIPSDDSYMTTRVSVKSIYAARTIDINGIIPKLVYKIKDTESTNTNKVSSLFKERLNVSSSPLLPSPTTYRHTGNISVTLQYPPEENEIERYVVVFRFGSVVFINMKPADADVILKEIKAFSQGPASRPISEQKENFEIAIQPSIEFPTVSPDYVTVSQLNLNAVSVVSTVMAQTVAFDSYNKIVDELLANFAAINANVEKTGNFDMEKKNLFKVIAQNNSLFIDMVSKIGVLERSDTAWNFSQYEAIYQGMREEFELDDRFDHVEFKLNMIQQNTKFFLEILHNQKTQTLEYVIIILIAFECTLMTLDMTGLGGVVFQNILDLLK